MSVAQGLLWTVTTNSVRCCFPSSSLTLLYLCYRSNRPFCIRYHPSILLTHSQPIRSAVLDFDGLFGFRSVSSRTQSSDCAPICSFSSLPTVVKIQSELSSFLQRSSLTSILLSSLTLLAHACSRLESQLLFFGVVLTVISFTRAHAESI
jgi:hypothetical protein